MPACSSSSTWSAFSTLATWPISSTTSTAVSWSTGWLIVAMTPMLSIVFMTSLDLTAMRWASSATVMVSPIATSRCTGSVGSSKPCLRSAPALAARRRGSGRERPFLCRADKPAGDVQFLAPVTGALVVHGGLARLFLAGAALLLGLLARLLLGLAARLFLGLALGRLLGRAALALLALAALLFARFQLVAHLRLGGHAHRVLAARAAGRAPPGQRAPAPRARRA